MPGAPRGEGRKPPIDLREPLLLVGTCNAWGKDADDTQRRYRFVEEAAEGAGESQVRLRLALAGKTLSFQIISARRAWQWRLCPCESSRSERTLQRGCWRDAELFLDPDDEAAHGRNFRVSGEGTVIITVLRGNGRAQVRCRAVASETPKEESDEAFFTRMFNGEEVSSRRVELVPLEGTPEVRVAAMLMLLPRAVRDCPGVFRTYLRYHLLAPQGPRLAHIFVFVDGEPDEASAALELWLGASPPQLRSRVSLIDGAGSACLKATSHSRRAASHSNSRIREAASRGELSAKQVLNMERCLLLAKEEGIDWLICNLDVDEALVCGGSAGEVFAAAPPRLRQLQLLNHEAVPEEAPEEDAEVAGRADFFRGCTLFKRNPYLLNEDAAPHMQFWSERAAAAAAAAAGDENWDRGNRPLQLYFSGYCNGKSAVRVALCQRARPLGPHAWGVGPENSGRASTRAACVLHYNNCEGAEGLLRKYTTRRGERWNELRLHQLCLQLEGSALAKLFEQGLLLTKRKSQVAKKQLAAGVLLRIHSVQRALKELA